jgi:hypothetical protein
VSPGARGFLAVRGLEDLGKVGALRPDLAVIKSGRYGRVIDAELETSLPADHVAHVLSAMVEVGDVRVESFTPAAVESAAPASTARPEGATGPAANTVGSRPTSSIASSDAVGERS